MGRPSFLGACAGKFWLVLSGGTVKLPASSVFLGG